MEPGIRVKEERGELRKSLLRSRSFGYNQNRDLRDRPAIHLFRGLLRGELSERIHLPGAGGEVAAVATEPLSAVLRPGGDL